MGEVYRPDDVVGKKEPSNLSPSPRGFVPTSLQDVIREIKWIKAEINKIKQVLRANNIVIE